jgi:hypothetical protein
MKEMENCGRRGRGETTVHGLYEGLGFRVLMEIFRLSSKIGELGGAVLFTLLLEMPALG